MELESRSDEKERKKKRKEKKNPVYPACSHTIVGSDGYVPRISTRADIPGTTVDNNSTSLFNNIAITISAFHPNRALIDCRTFHTPPWAEFLSRFSPKQEGCDSAHCEKGGWLWKGLIDASLGGYTTLSPLARKLALLSHSSEGLSQIVC